MIVEVSLYNGPQPFPELRHGQMSASSKLLPRNTVDLDPNFAAAHLILGESYVQQGKHKQALRVIRELQAISGKRYVSPYGVAQIYSTLNDKEQTYKWLEAAYRDRAVWMSYLAVDPVFDSIRSEARFRDLLRRVGLLA